METKEAIAKKIRQVRMAQGWTQKELATRLGEGLTAQNVSDYERGRVRVPSDVVFRLAALLDLPADWFYGKSSEVDPFERLREILIQFETQEEAEEDEKRLDRLELADPKDETFPWGYNFRSEVILWRWKEILQHRGYSLKYAVPPRRHGYAFTIEPSVVSPKSDKAVHLVVDASADVSFRENCLYALPSPFRHRLPKHLFENFLPQIKTSFSISDKSDLFFGFKTHTVKIEFNKESLFSLGLEHQIDLDDGKISGTLRRAFEENGFPLSQDVTLLKKEDGLKWQITDDNQRQTYIVKKEQTELNIHNQEIYSPEYRSRGDGKGHFVDYASLIYVAFPKMRNRGLGQFESLLLLGGCHRLGTGIVAYLATHPKFLQTLLRPTGITAFEDSFEAIFKIEATTGVPLTTDAISLEVAEPIGRIITQNP